MHKIVFFISFLFISCSFFSENTVLEFVTHSLPNAEAGQKYNASIITISDKISILNYEIVEGYLPEGIILNSYTGNFSGLPRCNQGDYNFSVSVTNQKTKKIITRNFNLHVGPWKWLLFFYMDGDNSLSSMVKSDFEEISSQLSLAYGIKLVILIDQDEKETLLYENYTSANSDLDVIPLSCLGYADDEELNMADGGVLRNLVSYGVKAFPSVQRGLIIWDHGSGWRSLDCINKSLSKNELGETRSSCIDYSSEGDVLYSAELDEAINGFSFDIIGFDLCYGAMFEVAYELRNSTHFMVGSEQKEAEEGWNYADIFKRFCTGNMSDESLAQAIVESYGDEYEGLNYSLSALNLTAIETLYLAWNELSEVLYFSCDSQTAIQEIKNILLSAENYTSIPGDRNIDVYNTADLFDQDDYDPEIQMASLLVKQALDNVVLKNWSSPDHHSHGLAVHLVSLKTASPEFIFNPFDEAYFKHYAEKIDALFPLDFVSDSSWCPDIVNKKGLLYRLFYEEI